MAEVVFNIAGMRLPVVMTVANRAISGPLSIWNDHQDSMTLRDAGWLQIFAQTAQEAHDLHLIGFRVAEDARVLLPAMLCVDGFVLTHAYEPVETLTQEEADRFLPPIDSPFSLDPEHPMTLGTYAEPAVYEEGRYAIEQAQQAARGVLEEAFHDFAEVTGRSYHPWFDAYRLEDAAVALVAMGTAAQTARLAIDHARDEGIPAGLLALRTFRPFPGDRIREALKHITRVVVLDRSVSLGAGSIVANEFRAALSESAYPADVVGVVAGLGGRDVSIETLERALRAEKDTWIDLKRELVGEMS
jgi:pyruvate ferredoxin oxidoreductase alpha subunit